MMTMCKSQVAQRASFRLEHYKSEPLRLPHAELCDLVSDPCLAPRVACIIPYYTHPLQVIARRHAAGGEDGDEDEDKEKEEYTYEDVDSAEREEQDEDLDEDSDANQIDYEAKRHQKRTTTIELLLSDILLPATWSHATKARAAESRPFHPTASAAIVRSTTLLADSSLLCRGLRL